MIEIKCPPQRQITGVVPKNYWCQMQVQLEVANLEVCDFVECKFVECGQEECMEAHSDYNGAIGEMYKCQCSDADCNCYNNVENRTYIYPNVAIAVESQKEFIKVEYLTKYAQTHKLKRNIFWVLKVYSQVQVTRDRNWWSENISGISEAWERILKYRENPTSIEKLVKTHQSPAEFIAQENYSLCFD
jgi:hypothetical protein